MVPVFKVPENETFVTSILVQDTNGKEHVLVRTKESGVNYFYFDNQKIFEISDESFDELENTYGYNAEEEYFNVMLAMMMAQNDIDCYLN